MALGLLEPEQAVEIRSHLADACPRCTEQSRKAAQIWSAYGLVLAEERLLTPSRHLRRRILNSIGDTSLSAFWGMWSWWSQSAAAAAALAIAAGLGWFVANRQITTAPAPVAQQQPATQPSTTAIEQQNQQLQQQVAELQRQLSTRPIATPGTPAELARLNDALANAQSATAAAQQEVQRTQARVTELETQIQGVETQLATARQERQDAETRFTAAVKERAAAQLELQKQVAAYTLRVRQLETQNTQLQQVLLRERQSNQQSIQLVQFLTSPTIQFYRLRGQSGTQAMGHAYVAEGNRVLFYGQNLPALPPGRVYQLWLMRDQGPAVVSGGIFEPGTQPTVVHQFTDAGQIRSVRALAVTDEPAGGSPKPTGRKYLVGTRS